MSFKHVVLTVLALAAAGCPTPGAVPIACRSNANCPTGSGCNADGVCEKGIAGTSSGVLLVTPGSANVALEASQKFTATVGQLEAPVDWDVIGAGTITADGTYTAPTTLPDPAQVTIRAIRSGNSPTTATALVFLVAKIGPGQLACVGGTVACGNKCVDLSTDASHCGVCGNGCLFGQVCSAGLCSTSCSGGTTKCGSDAGARCADLNLDRSNCGACGTQCATGQVCSSGGCGLLCAGGTTKCGTQCVDTSLDPASCGICGNACPQGQVCSAGTCGLSCTGGTTKCGTRCVDTTLDSSNCGSCGSPCSQGKVCSAGACGLSCGGGSTKCGSQCVDLTLDPSNCTACGMACPQGQVCSVGGCGLSCTGGSTKCGTRCVDTRLDPSNCGTCSTACTQGQVCSTGICGLSCSGGSARCGAQCVDLNLDSANCGSCGNACVQGQVCSAKTCGLSCAGGTTLCGTRCADRTVDPANCGTCSNACPVNNTCMNSVCVPFCTSGLSRCGNACFDFQTSFGNCGGCSASCSVASTCIAGACVPPKSCKALLAANPSAVSGTYTIDPDGAGPGAPFDVYCDMITAGGGWTLVMKLGAGDFCFGAVNWSSSAPLNEAATLTTDVPGVGTFDAKSRAFYALDDAIAIRFVTTLNTVTTTFAVPSSPRTLITTNTVPFAIYPDRTAWVTAFGHDRSAAPIFMRAGVAVTAGNTCRTNPEVTPSGCGKPCMFCYQASSGSCCGCAAANDDTSSGIGLNAAFCGGAVTNCSTAGNWSNTTTRTLIWAR